MVYGTQMTIVTGVYKPTNITGGPHIVEMQVPFSWHNGPPTKTQEQTQLMRHDCMQCDCVTAQSTAGQSKWTRVDCSPTKYWRLVELEGLHLLTQCLKMTVFCAPSAWLVSGRLYYTPRMSNNCARKKLSLIRFRCFTFTTPDGFNENVFEHNFMARPLQETAS